MTGVGSTSVINAAPGRLIVHTFGMRTLSKALTTLTFDDVHKVYAKAIKAAAEPVAADARSRAPKTSGDFAGSIDIIGGRLGATLRSTDPGAGVIAFAGPSDTPDQARYGFGDVLTKRFGSPDRAFFPAIEAHIGEVAAATQVAVEWAYSQLCDREWTQPD